MAETKSKSSCRAPQCTNSKQKQPYFGFHDFPSNLELRNKWVQAIKSDEGVDFKIKRGRTFVCTQHFNSSDLNGAIGGNRESPFDSARVRLGVSHIRCTPVAETRTDLQETATTDPTASIEHDYMSRPPPGSAHRYHPCADLGGEKTNTRCPLTRVPLAARFFTHCRITMQPPRATALEDNVALGSLQASPQSRRQTTGVAGAW
ncbi:UNVERIFIED_CONTAM: hypothetical protein FKN15_006123 [Acipenser sinensis]